MIKYSSWSFDEIFLGSSRLELVDWIMQIPSGLLHAIWKTEIGDNIKRLILTSDSASSQHINEYSYKCEEILLSLNACDDLFNPALTHQVSSVALCMLVLGKAKDCKRILSTNSIHPWLQDWINLNLADLQEASVQESMLCEQVFASPYNIEALLANLYLCATISLVANLFVIDPSNDEYQCELNGLRQMLITCLQNTSEAELASLLEHPTRRLRFTSMYRSIVNSGICRASKITIPVRRIPSDLTILSDSCREQVSLNQTLCLVLCFGETSKLGHEQLSNAYPWISEITCELLA